MRKTFQLHVEGKHPERLVEAIKHEIRKYFQRERRRPLPQAADFWDFDCKFGVAEASAEVIHHTAINSLIDGVVKAGGPQFYVEVLAKPGKRQPRPVGEPAEDSPED